MVYVADVRRVDTQDAAAQSLDSRYPSGPSPRSISALVRIAVEALVRWEHPTRGLLAASRVHTVAEETGLVTEIGRWVFAEACRQLAIWQRSTRTALHRTDQYVARRLQDGRPR